MLPQVFHIRRTWRSRVSLIVVLIALIGAAVPLVGQTPHLRSTYRVFLKNGDALPSYGEAAVVDDRIVFNLSIGGLESRLTLQLISLPLPLVDLERTSRYAEAMRAAFYAATRGQTEYDAMTTALSHDLEALAALPDRKRQLGMAEELRERLLDWPRAHFFYRADDVEKLAGLVSDVINELKTAVGEKAFAFELSAGPPVPERESLLPLPRRREALELSLSASAAADIGEDRVAILRAASELAPADDPKLAAAVKRRLDEELRAGAAYATLASDLRKRARASVDRGDAPSIDRLEKELLARDQQLGFRRPQVVQSLVSELGNARTAALERRETLARYAAVRGRLIDYEMAVRPAFSALDGLRPVLEHVRDARPLAFERIVAAHNRLERVRGQIESVQPPDETGGIHATLVSALRMAIEACLKRREAAATTAMPTMRAASSAAAGALLLADRARTDLVDSLCLGGRVSTCGP
jgi:hypothetical protein